MEDIVMDDSLFEDVVDVDVSTASNVIVEDSFASFASQGFACSTPRKPRTRSVAASKKSQNKLQCEECKRFYANERTLGIHKKMHIMKELSSRFPKKCKLEDMSVHLLKSALEEIIQEEKTYDMDPELTISCSMLLECLSLLKTVCQSLAESLYAIMKRQNALLPSGLRSALYVGVNGLLCDNSFIKTVGDELMNVCDISETTVNILSGPLIIKFCDQAIVEILRHIRGAQQETSDQFKKRSKDSIDSMDFKQLVFYIGGAVVSGILRKGCRYELSQSWQIYIEVIKTNFLHEPLAANQCSAPVRLFTEEVDRGGLKYLNEEAFIFFLKLFDLLMSLEGDDGSLPFSIVDQKVYQDDVIVFLWDDLVGSELNEELSLELFNMVVRSCVRVVCNGILKRRLSEDLKKAYSSVSLRSRLAR